MTGIDYALIGIMIGLGGGGLTIICWINEFLTTAIVIGIITMILCFLCVIGMNINNLRS